MAKSRINFEGRTLPAEAETLRYKWIVLFCSFLVRLLVFGTVMSVGVLYVEWLDEFEMGLGNTALVGSIATGSVLLMGPISGALLDRFSCRQVIMLSGLCMSIGLVVSTFANGIPYLCVSFGIVTGCGGGMANLAAIVSLNQFFFKQRPLAMGIGSGGVGVGIFAFGFLQKHFVSLFTWRGSLLMLGGIQLHVVVCGLLMVHPDQLQHHSWLWNWRKSGKNMSTDDTSNQVKAITAENDDVPEIVERNEVLSSIDKQIEDGKGSNNDVERGPNLKKRKGALRVIRAKMKLTQKTIDLWKNPTFVILFISDFLSWLVQFVPYVHLPKRASVLGIEHGSLLISLMGISSAVGKVFFGAICTYFRLSPFKVFVVAQSLFGVSTVLSPFCLSFWSLCLFAISFGFLSGTYSLMMVVPARLLGEEKFSLAYGFMLAGEGVGVYLGPPLVGWISDATKSYNSSFFLAGCTLLASALVLMVKPLIQRIKRNKKRDPDQKTEL